MLSKPWSCILVSLQFIVSSSTWALGNPFYMCGKKMPTELWMRECMSTVCQDRTWEHIEETTALGRVCAYVREKAWRADRNHLEVKLEFAFRRICRVIHYKHRNTRKQSHCLKNMEDPFWPTVAVYRKLRIIWSMAGYDLTHECLSLCSLYPTRLNGRHSRHHDHQMMISVLHLIWREYCRKGLFFM